MGSKISLGGMENASPGWRMEIMNPQMMGTRLMKVKMINPAISGICRRIARDIQNASRPRRDMDQIKTPMIEATISRVITPRAEAFPTSNW